jgi:hypothetical protein
MVKLKVTINVSEVIEASIVTSCIVKAENRDEAKKCVNEMLDEFEFGDSPLADALVDLCEDDIRDFHDDQDTWNNINVSTDILSIEPEPEPEVDV